MRDCALRRALRHALAKSGLEPLLAFQRFDVRGDGAVGAGDLWAGLRRLGLACADEEDVAHVVAEADHDRDGALVFDEFLAVAAPEMDADQAAEAAADSPGRSASPAQ